jgi:hypothetical protein
MDSFYEFYAKHREFWGVLPDLIWALSYRRSASFLLVFRVLLLTVEAVSLEIFFAKTGTGARL